MSVSRDETPAISVIIVNWNAKSELAQCLQSLQRQTLSTFETIVVDNGSSDGSLALLREQFPTVIVIEAGENLGFAQGVNRGLSLARGAWIATLNNDTVADPQWIERLQAVVETAPAELGMLQSHMAFRDDRNRINSTGLLLFRDATAADRGFGKADGSEHWSQEIFCPTAGAALYRRSMLDQVQLPTGIFDGSFFMYYEDVDLGWRCRLAGFTARYVPDAIVFHAFQGSSRRHGNRFVPLHCKRNRWLALARNASWSLVLRSSPRTLLDLIWIAFLCGPAALIEALPLVRAALSQRSIVTGLMRQRREDIERVWLKRRG
jgi:GT2 family glycosyltransferase